MLSARFRALARAAHALSVLVATTLIWPGGSAAQPRPGDVVTVTTLSANFDADNPNQPPDLTLPGAPTGDFLTLDTTAGTVDVVPSYDGLSRPAQIRQVNMVGKVLLVGHAISTPAPPRCSTHSSVRCCSRWIPRPRTKRPSQASTWLRASVSRK